MAALLRHPARAPRAGQSAATSQIYVHAWVNDVAVAGMRPHAWVQLGSNARRWICDICADNVLELCRQRRACYCSTVLQ